MPNYLKTCFGNPLEIQLFPQRHPDSHLFFLQTVDTILAYSYLSWPASLTMIIPPQPVLGCIMGVWLNQITATFTLWGSVESGHWSPFIGVKTTTEQRPCFFWSQKPKENILYTMLRYQKTPNAVTTLLLLHNVLHVVQAFHILRSCWLGMDGRDIYIYIFMYIHLMGDWEKNLVQWFWVSTYYITSPQNAAIDLHTYPTNAALVSLSAVSSFRSVKSGSWCCSVSRREDGFLPGPRSWMLAKNIRRNCFDI